MFGKLKPYVERYPVLTFAYRTLRDAWAFQRQEPQATPHGFKLMGNPTMQAGAFEPEETALIEHLLNSADVFVDAGANIGFYTCLARASGKHTLAIEPLPQNLDYLYANLDANGWPDVEVYSLGLAERPGLGTLYGGTTGASLVDGWAAPSPLLRRRISVSTLDILLGDRFAGKKLLIKVDVEGAEYDLLLGAGHTLVLSSAPVWMVEIGLTEHHPAGLNPHFARTFELFWQHGYQAWTASLERRAISRADVERWVKSRTPSFGTGNYLFAKIEP